MIRPMLTVGVRRKLGRRKVLILVSGEDDDDDVGNCSVCVCVCASAAKQVSRGCGGGPRSQQFRIGSRFGSGAGWGETPRRDGDNARASRFFALLSFLGGGVSLCVILFMICVLVAGFCLFCNPRLRLLFLFSSKRVRARNGVFNMLLKNSVLCVCMFAHRSPPSVLSYSLSLAQSVPFHRVCLHILIIPFSLHTSSAGFLVIIC